MHILCSCVLKLNILKNLLFMTFFKIARFTDAPVFHKSGTCPTSILSLVGGRRVMLCYVMLCYVMLCYEQTKKQIFFPVVL
jgi:hypothetical protein